MDAGRAARTTEWATCADRLDRAGTASVVVADGQQFAVDG